MWAFRFSILPSSNFKIWNTNSIYSVFLASFLLIKHRILTYQLTLLIYFCKIEPTWLKGEKKAWYQNPLGKNKPLSHLPQPHPLLIQFYMKYTCASKYSLFRNKGEINKIKTGSGWLFFPSFPIWRFL